MDKITEYLNIPLSHALAAKFGAKLEKLTAPDKLDVAQAILTAIAWGDTEGSVKSVGETIAEFGSVMPNAPNSETVVTIIDAHQTSTEELFGLATLLTLHLQMGAYADA